MKHPHIGSVTPAGIWSYTAGEYPYQVGAREDKRPGGNVMLLLTTKSRRVSRSLGFGVRDFKGRFDRHALNRAASAAKDASARLRLDIECDEEGDVPVLVADPVSVNERVRFARQYRDGCRAAGLRECTVCGWPSPAIGNKTLVGLHGHHIVPLAAGGANSHENMVLVCANCHSIAHALWGDRHGPTDKEEFANAILDVIHGAEFRGIEKRRLARERKEARRERIRNRRGG